MGMFQYDITTTLTCPRCDASMSVTRTHSQGANPASMRVGSCDVCGWDRDNKPPYISGPTQIIWKAIPESAEPRDGVQKLAANADISIPAAARVLDPDTDTTLDDVAGDETN